MKEYINRIFDKLEKADTSPSSNYSMPEYWMHWAIRGRDKDKQTLFNWLSATLSIDIELLNQVFNERYNGIKTENKHMNNKLIRLTESDLHKIVKESVNGALREGVEFSSEDPQEEWIYYQNKLQQEFDELGVMVLNKIPKNDPDRQIVQRYIKMIQTHLHALEN